MSGYDSSSIWTKLKNAIKRWMDSMKKNKSQPLTNTNTTTSHTTSSAPARTAPPATLLAMQRSQAAATNQNPSETTPAAPAATSNANGKLPQRASDSQAPGGTEVSPSEGADVRAHSIDAAQSIGVSTLDKEEEGVSEEVGQTAQMKEMAVKSRAATTSPTPSDGTVLSNRGSVEGKNQVKLVEIRPAQRSPPAVDKVDPLTAPEVVNHFDDEKMPVLSEPTPTSKRPGLPTGMSATSGPLEDFPMGAEHY